MYEHKILFVLYIKSKFLFTNNALEHHYYRTFINSCIIIKKNEINIEREHQNGMHASISNLKVLKQVEVNKKQNVYYFTKLR